MKIALVSTSLGMGGAEKAVVELADGLAQQGHDVLLCYLTGVQDFGPSNPGVQVVRLGLDKGSDLLAGFLRMRALLRSFRPDVVHSHLFHANILCRLVRLATPMPALVSTAHSTDPGSRLRVFAYKMTNWLSDTMTNVSQDATDAFVRLGAASAGKIITVHNGIAVDQFRRSPSAAQRVRDELSIPPGMRVLVCVGRLDKPKDYPNLLRALRIVKDAAPFPFVALVAGGGPLKAELAEQCRSLDLVDSVRFLGVRKDVPSLLSASDLFVLSSAWEGLPMVIGEAMAAECLIVSTDCGGVREFLGEYPFIAPVRDPHALADKILAAFRLTADEKGSITIGLRDRVGMLFSLPAAVRAWLEIYRRVGVKGPSVRPAAD